MANTTDFLVYIGTYTTLSGSDDGIYVNWLSLRTGELRLASTVKGVSNPSYLAVDPSNHYLYAVSESSGSGDDVSGAVSAYALDQQSGELTFLNQQSSMGNGPCHVSVDQTGRWVMVANYNSGSIAIYPVLADGQLGEASDFIQHVGSSVNSHRQEGPHAHFIGTDPTNNLVLAVDLGLDKVMIYQLDKETGKLSPHDPPWLTTPPGAGPRHFAFHPDGKHLFVINELDSTIISFAYDAADGSFRELGIVSTLPASFDGESTCAAVKVAPSGKFVYGSNRGHDSIAIFEFNDGTLIPRGYASTEGQTPRDFAIDPTGSFLLAANQDTNTVVTFRIDSLTGQLRPNGQIASISAPVCVKILEV
ncbi:MAG: lactonase family protein [Anaerolineae bacterium]|nr:lactonase family protein [Anaerolineae bacterium]